MRQTQMVEALMMLWSSLHHYAVCESNLSRLAGGDGAFQSQSDYHDRVHESHIYNSMHEAGRDNAEWIRKHTAQSLEL